MKKKLMFLFFISTILAHAKLRNVDVSKTIEKNGIVHVTKESTPFTGMVIDKKDREFYTKGIPDGKWLTFYPNGKLKSIENWKKGSLDGKYVIYRKDGTKTFETVYKEGKDNGLFKLYHDNGQLQILGMFSNGNPYGVWNYYSKEGKLTGKVNYGKKQNYFDQNN
ncbi:MAG: toxin-antitoxin system YwqK family antitoxin [Cetobacterium sp.]|uniref:toxin-antitoxin system YwqK family antitoxin n=1 Tax=unclassified Cetobacterium TaxID=2630983 RepID=UPI00163BB6EF|nr:toxin-antitoxin system YwqK family antitoxin [Cetobacterium sp. 2A]MBC2855781.1 toxin-antitoxin system YwqK family antitoxin [Cetobacterium sp. 2A]